MTHKQKLKQALQELDALKEKVKGLIDPELGVEKWYRCTDNSLIFFSGISDFRDDSCGYGFLSNGDWVDERNGYSFIQSPHLWKEATPKEVEQALIKEAKRRYIPGDKVTRLKEYHYGNSNNIIKNVFSLMEGGRLIADSDNGYFHCLFKDGVWADVIKEDNFAELKEAHRNGAVIQVWNEPAWITCVPNWHPDFQYRIKPEKSCPLNDDIQYLKNKHPEYNFTIIAEKK